MVFFNIFWVLSVFNFLNNVWLFLINLRVIKFCFLLFKFGFVYLDLKGFVFLVVIFGFFGKFIGLVNLKLLLSFEISSFFILMYFGLII